MCSIGKIQIIKKQNGHFFFYTCFQLNSSDEVQKRNSGENTLAMQNSRQRPANRGKKIFKGTFLVALTRVNYNAELKI